MGHFCSLGNVLFLSWLIRIAAWPWLMLVFHGITSCRGIASLSCECENYPEASGIAFLFSTSFFNNYLLVLFSPVQFSSVAQPCLTLWHHEPQHARPPCPSPTPRVHPNPYPLSRWCHQTISSSVVLFSSCLQSFPASGSFQMSQLFASGGQSIGISASASVLPMNIQDWFPLRRTGWISLQSKGLSRVFSNTTVQKHQFFSAQLSL